MSRPRKIRLRIGGAHMCVDWRVTSRNNDSRRQSEARR
jgi:hypothetical protein